VTTTDQPPVSHDHAAEPAPLPPQSAASERAARAQACFDDLAALMQKYRCTLVPQWSALDPVGRDGRRVQLEVTFAVAAMP